MPQTKDVSTSSAGTLTVPALTAPLGTTVGLAPALPPGATVSRGVAQTLQQLADAHNAVHGRDRKKRADLRGLRAAYRRGASRKPRPGRSRRQEGLARAQAHLAALAGKELPAEYAADRELLPGEEKRLAVLALEGGVAEPEAHLKALGVAEPPAHDEPVTEPATEQKDAPAAVETKAWSDEARVAALAARRAHVQQHGMSDDAVRKYGPPVGLTSDHEFHRVASARDLKAGDLIELHEGHLHAVAGEPQYVPPVGPDPTALGHYNVPLAGHDRPARVLENRHSGEVRQFKPNAADLSAVAHHISEGVRGYDPQGHEEARRAHIAAADAHKAAGDEESALNHVMFADSHRERADQGQELAKARKPDPETPPYHVGDTEKHPTMDAADLRVGDYLQHSGKHVRVASVDHHGGIAAVRFRDDDFGIGHAYLRHGTTHRVTRVVRPDEKA